MYFCAMRIRNVYIVIATFLLLLSACKGKEEAIPAYIRIDSLAVNVTPEQGSEIHEIAAVNVYVDEQYLGLFEIPCTIPALYSGSHKLTLIPSVRLNGANNQYYTYRHLKNKDTTIFLTPGKITQTSTLAFSYKSNTEFAWVEDFEDNNSSLIRLFSSKGDTSFISNEDYSLNGHFARKTPCLKVVMSAADSAKTIDMASFKYFSGLPMNGSDLMFEFDVKSPLPLQMAMIRKNSSGKQYLPYVYIFETGGKWKRFYINLIYELYNQPADTEIQLLLSPMKDPGLSGKQEIFFDNIRFSYLK